MCENASLAGDRAAITGAGSGIGRQIAAHFVDAGVDVAIVDIDGEALEDAEQALGDSEGDVLAVRGDAADPADVREFIDEAVDAFGGLDILINNVGIAGPTKPCTEVTHEEFMGTLSVNLGGPFNASTVAIPHLVDGGGRIVNIASMSGKRPLPNRTPYTTSKMGVIGFTRTLAVELADADVTVNAVCPGSVDGPRLEAVIEQQARARGASFETVEAEFRSASPMDEFVTASDVADAVCWLCSDRAAKITGQDLNVTAGIVMY